MRYVVGHSYYARRDGQDYGPWPAGVEIELPDEVAEWALRDSPGVLSPVVVAPEPEPEPVVVDEEPADESEREAKPARNRQHRGGRNRATD